MQSPASRPIRPSAYPVLCYVFLACMHIPRAPHVPEPARTPSGASWRVPASFSRPRCRVQTRSCPYAPRALDTTRQPRIARPACSSASFDAIRPPLCSILLREHGDLGFGSVRRVRGPLSRPRVLAADRSVSTLQHVRHNCGRSGTALAARRRSFTCDLLAGGPTACAGAKLQSGNAERRVYFVPHCRSRSTLFPNLLHPFLPSQRRFRAIFLRLDVRCVCRHIDGRFGFPVPSLHLRLRRDVHRRLPLRCGLVRRYGLGALLRFRSDRSVLFYSNFAWDILDSVAYGNPRCYASASSSSLSSMCGAPWFLLRGDRDGSNLSGVLRSQTGRSPTATFGPTFPSRACTPLDVQCRITTPSRSPLRSAALCDPDGFLSGRVSRRCSTSRSIPAPTTHHPS